MRLSGYIAIAIRDDKTTFTVCVSKSNWKHSNVCRTKKLERPFERPRVISPWLKREHLSARSNSTREIKGYRASMSADIDTDVTCPNECLNDFCYGRLSTQPETARPNTSVYFFISPRTNKHPERVFE
jgi:hypothetical protein